MAARMCTSGVVSSSRCVGQNSALIPKRESAFFPTNQKKHVWGEQGGDALLGFSQYETMHSSWYRQ